MFSRISRLALVLTLLAFPVNANVINSFIKFPSAPAAGDIDITSFSYASKSCNMNTVLGITGLTGARWADSGNKVHVVDTSSDTVQAVDLSTAYDLSTCSDASESLDVSGTHIQPQEIEWNDDGTILGVLGNNADDVEFYVCTTPWLATDANCSLSSGDTIPTAAFENNPRAFAWCSARVAGVMGSAGDGFEQIDCSADYDGSSCSFTDYTSSGINTPEGLDFVNAQQGIFVSSDTDSVYEATFTADCDFSTFTVGSNISVTSQDTVPTSVDIGNSNATILVCGSGTNSCYQYE